MPPKETPKKFNISPELMLVYKAAFDLFDPKQTGLVKCTEVAWLVRTLGRTPSNQEIDDILDELDPDAVGVIKFEQFLEVIDRPQLYGFCEEEIREAFRTFDKDDVGYIVTAEMGEHLGTLAEKFDEDEVKEFKRMADFEAEGRFDYEAFVTRSFSKNPVPKPKKVEKPKKADEPPAEPELTPEEAAAAAAIAAMAPPAPA